VKSLQGDHGNGRVHRVTEEGVERSQWFINHPASDVRCMTLNPAGTFIEIVTYNQVYVYSLATLHVQCTHQLSENNMFHNEFYASAVFRNNDITSLSIGTAEGYYKGQLMCNDDHGVLLSCYNYNKN